VTVRTWFTISAIVVVALFAAVAVRLFVPGSQGPPDIVVRVGDVRLDGAVRESCWPQRDGAITCEERTDTESESHIIPAAGSMRIFVSYPAQPKRGSIVISNGRRTVLKRKWTHNFRYSLDPGSYTLTVEAGYEPEAGTTTRPSLVYDFDFRVTRSGS
jgi:hypothetical protein